MTISIDNGSGFCFGVTGAIRKAEEELSKGALFCLGDIVHNGQEVKRLAQLGLETIDYDDLRTLHNIRVLPSLNPNGIRNSISVAALA